jgi:hypothetical protein
MDIASLNVNLTQWPYGGVCGNYNAPKKRAYRRNDLLCEGGVLQLPTTFPGYRHLRQVTRSNRDILPKMGVHGVRPQSAFGTAVGLGHPWICQIMLSRAYFFLVGTRRLSSSNQFRTKFNVPTDP